MIRTDHWSENNICNLETIYRNSYKPFESDHNTLQVSTYIVLSFQCLLDDLITHKIDQRSQKFEILLIFATIGPHNRMEALSGLLDAIRTFLLN